jgi:16S rRNA (guanine966-N2)-methyltransferase
MRVISGKFRGKKITLPKDKKTRPLRDLVKESIFNLIQHSNKFDCVIDNSNILDLFSGSGSFGIECISRNAKKVVFIENYKEAIKVLKKNTSIFNKEEKYKIFDEDCFNFFKSKKLSDKFNIIFLDPPYKEEKINILIDNIKKKEILSNDGIIIIHRHKKDNIDVSKNLNILDERNYGISKIIIGN